MASGDTMDKGLWISWYDLGEADTKGYLSWLHEHYLPGILKRTGIIWAAHYEAEKMAPPSRLGHTKDQSVPQGGEYIQPMPFRPRVQTKQRTTSRPQTGKCERCGAVSA
jgi:hypothetical protein